MVPAPHRPPKPPTEGPAAALGISGRPAKRSFTIGGHRTSISLEAAFWEALKAAADEDGVPVSRLIAQIDAARSGCGLSSAIRVWLLMRYRHSRHSATPPRGAAPCSPRRDGA